MLVDWMGCWLADSVTALGVDARDGIGEAAEAVKEGGSIQALRDVLAVHAFPERGCDVRQVALPVRVVDADLSIIELLYVQTGQLGDDAIPHKGADAHRTVVRAGDRMADAGIDTPHFDFL